MITIKALEQVSWEDYWKKIKVKKSIDMKLFVQDIETGGKVSITLPDPRNLNLQQYKFILLDKLKDTLEIAGFNVAEIHSEILNEHYP